MFDCYTVRNVREEDLPTLVEIEQARWEREGTEILTYATLKEWYDVHSPFFLVAEKGGRLDGFYYAIQVHFSFDEISKHTAPEAQTGHGWSIHTHDPSAKTVYAVNVVQRSSEAGAALNKELRILLQKREMVYFIGAPRLVNLDRYLRTVERENGGTLPYKEEDIALWYAHESMKLLHQTTTWEASAPQPVLDLPKLRRPDSLLRFSTESLRAGLICVIPNLMKDPKSRGYGAFLASDFSTI